MNRACWIGVLAICLVVAGCESSDERLVWFAEQSAQRQAEQNREMAALNREVAQAHQELIGLQQDLEKQQAEINRGRDLLESERREIAKQRHRDPILAAAINNVGLILACLVPLALAGYLLYCLRDRSDDQVVSEILIEELVSEHPVLLPSPQPTPSAIEDHREPKPPWTAMADAGGEEDSTE